MRVAAELLAGETTGSTWGDRLDVTASYGTDAPVTGLQVSKGSFEWDASNPVQGVAKLTIVDETGRLQPYGPTHPLNCWGSRLQLMVTSGATKVQVPFGPWRIRGSVPTGRYQVKARGGDWDVKYAGGTVEVTANEILAEAVLYKLDGESPQTSTYLDEIRRLLWQIAPVVVDPAVQDKPLPANLTYNESRINHVQDHIARLDAAYRIGPDGALHIVPRRGIGEPLRMGIGNAGDVVEIGHSFTDADAANIFVAEGRGPDNQPIIGRDRLVGPMSPDSPLGPIPRFKRSTAETQPDVNEDAETMRAEYQAAGEAVVDAVVLTNSAVQMQDRVELPLLTVAGVIPVVGRAVKMRMTVADGLIAKSMRISAAVPMEKLEEIQYRIDRHHG